MSAFVSIAFVVYEFVVIVISALLYRRLKWERKHYYFFFVLGSLTVTQLTPWNVRESYSINQQIISMKKQVYGLVWKHTASSFMFPNWINLFYFSLLSSEKIFLQIIKYSYRQYICILSTFQVRGIAWTQLVIHSLGQSMMSTSTHSKEKVGV